MTRQENASLSLLKVCHTLVCKEHATDVVQNQFWERNLYEAILYFVWFKVDNYS